MGILTDPSLTPRNQWAHRFIKHTRKICIILYLGGIIWFCCLGHKDFNHATYLSENALSPGLVYSEIKQDSARFAQTMLDELNRERINHKTKIPYSWLIAKMKQIGLETHTHNFTLNYPFGGGKKFEGKNVYGIFRAPRISSTEAIVFSVPYRPPNSVHTEITASIPILLAFADFARKKNYWSKDLVFVITDQEQLGIHAWIEAYFQGGQNDKSVLNAGNLPARAGALQAALNLEIQDLDCDYFDVKLEGLNGQLPNLDMFNLVQRLAIREGLPSGYKQTTRKKRSASQTSIKENLIHMLNAILTQANGVPTGNHGLFHRYRVEALTLEGVKRSTINNQNNRFPAAYSLLKTVEGISRSLNNLLEKFHQSFFFYILVANDRFVSIGDFIACLILMAGSLYIKSFLTWLKCNDYEKIDNQSEDKKEKNTSIKFSYSNVGYIFGVTIFFGILAGYIPLNKQLNDIFAMYNINTELGIVCVLVIIAILALTIPIFVQLTIEELELLHICTLLYVGSVLIVVGLLNFALGFISAIIIVPLAILLDLRHESGNRFLSIIYTFLIHPLVLIYLAALLFTLRAFPELDFQSITIRAASAAMNGITLTAVDFIIYNNWLYGIMSMVYFPAWILFWVLNCARRNSDPKKLKIN